MSAADAGGEENICFEKMDGWRRKPVDFSAAFEYYKDRKTGDILLVRLAPKIRFLSRALDRRVGRQQKNLKLSGRTALRLDGTESRRTTENPVIYEKAGWNRGVGGFLVSNFMEETGVNMNYSKNDAIILVSLKKHNPRDNQGRTNVLTLRKVLPVCLSKWNSFLRDC